MSEQSSQPCPSQETLGTFEQTARSHLKHSWTATPTQCLAWLEEALEIAYQAGALRSKTQQERSDAEGSEKK